MYLCAYYDSDFERIITLNVFSYVLISSLQNYQMILKHVHRVHPENSFSLHPRPGTSSSSSRANLRILADRCQDLWIDPDECIGVVHHHDAVEEDPNHSYEANIC